MNYKKNDSISTDSEDRQKYERLIHKNCRQKNGILKDLFYFSAKYDLSFALKALFRQQVKSGFILSDPVLLSQKGHEKTYFDPKTSINFIFQWNPDRELRKNHQLLIQRGIIQKDIDSHRFIHKDNHNKPCYLCKHNIDLQNPKEILFPLHLNNEIFFAGANFAPITNNHFTIFPFQHRPQKYNKKTLFIMEDFLDQTKGNFRIIFNGRAGASIEKHEHFQGTSIPLPIEKIDLNNQNIIFHHKSLQIFHPFYYLPLWVFQAQKKDLLNQHLDIFLKKWRQINPEFHTQNLLALKKGQSYFFYLFLRHRKKLIVKEKAGAPATFEASGLFVFSVKPIFDKDMIKKDPIFRGLTDFDIIIKILDNISPVLSPKTRNDLNNFNNSF